MTRRRKRGGTSSERGVEEKRGKNARTSRAMLNFLARSLTLSSSVKPVIMPFILGSARGDRFPTGQLYLKVSHEFHIIPCCMVSFVRGKWRSLPSQDRNEGPWSIELVVSITV